MIPCSLIDLLYTNYGKAAYNCFGHSLAVDGMTDANLEYVIGLINSLKGIRHLSLDAALALRDGPRIDPATIAGLDIPSDHSAAIKASAAMHDSLITLTGHDNMLEVWVGPK